MKPLEHLTFHSLELQPVLIPLKRPIVSKVGSFSEWPVVAITLRTNEGVTGCSYLEPYLAHSMKYIVSIMSDLAANKKGKRIAPLSDFQAERKSLSLVGYEGLAMIAIAGLDMAAWDALAKAVNLPLARLLGGDIGTVPAYNSNALWLTDTGQTGRRSACPDRRRRLWGNQAPARARSIAAGYRRHRSGPPCRGRRHQTHGRFQSGHEIRRCGAPLP